MSRYDRILFATDFSEHAKHALDYAATVARLHGAEIEAVHVLVADESDAERAAQDLPGAVADEHSDVVTERRVVRAAKPELGILHAAREGRHDMIVLGTHGHTGLKHMFLGSVAERVVQLASCPVLTVRPPGHGFEWP